MVIFAGKTEAMDFLSELAWRGMLQEMTPGLEEYLRTERPTAYIGFDPTAPSLTIGNYVQVMLLKLFQQAGHHPVVLLGGATGRIGDPSGKDKERQLKSYEELDENLNFQKRQFLSLLDFTHEVNPAVFVNNLDYYQGLHVLDFLRDAGKTLTVNYMLSKDSVQQRLEGGISFTEFSYQLLQAYDFQCLYQQQDCRLQMGGSDQWGNITSGTEFIRRNLGGKAFALTTPLLTKADGSKFGKSAEGNIWLDSNLTSPYRFYQFWINADDADLPRLVRYFTMESRQTVEEKESSLDIREQKRLLAEELTLRIHGPEAYHAVQKVTQLLFNRSGLDDQQLTEVEFSMIAQEIPTFHLPRELTTGELGLTQLLTDHSPLFPSRGEWRRAVQNQAIRINGKKVVSAEETITSRHLFHEKYLLVENGKKNKVLYVFS